MKDKFLIARTEVLNTKPHKLHSKQQTTNSYSIHGIVLYMSHYYSAGDSADQISCGHDLHFSLIFVFKRAK